MSSKERRVLMLVVTKYDIVMISTPPRHPDDNYEGRAAQFCAIPNIQKITTDWKGNVYIVSGGDLYVGPMPTSKDMDWYAAAKKVSRKQFSTFKHIFFHPNGDLWAVNDDGLLFIGPPPTNQYLPWAFGEATCIGQNWHQFCAIFFDSTGTYLYGVNNSGTFYRGPPPAPGERWTDTATTLGNSSWYDLTYFMVPDADGNLWSVTRWYGYLYKGPLPTPEDNHDPYRNKKCTFVGSYYYRFPFICMTIDKTVASISKFVFLMEKGKRMSESTEVLEEKIYDNRESSNVLKHTYSFIKTVKQTSSFSHEHGFAFAFGYELSFKAGLPGVGESETSVSMNTSTTHNWKFTEENETEDTLKTSSEVEVKPGHAIRVVASVKKAILEVPYKAQIRTMFGQEDHIEGTWKGATHFNVMVRQEDYKG